MDDGVAILHQLVDELRVQDGAATELEVRVRPGPCEVVLPSGGEVVENHHAVSVRQQCVHQMGADEARSTGDKVTRTAIHVRLHSGSGGSDSAELDGS